LRLPQKVQEQFVCLIGLLLLHPVAGTIYKMLEPRPRAGSADTTNDRAQAQLAPLPDYC
jgi:hypothetical protein